MDLMHLVTVLHKFTTAYPVSIITKQHDVMIVAAAGDVSTTKTKQDTEVWRVRIAAAASVWWLQHPQKPFEALTVSVL